MPAHTFRIPVRHRVKSGQLVDEIHVPLQLQTADGSLVRVPFLFDTGTNFTTIPIGMADELQIGYAIDRPVDIAGATGKGQAKGFLSSVSFSFFDLPEWKFTATPCLASAWH